MTGICGIQCDNCDWKNDCAGCVPTGGRPFGGECVLAACGKKRGPDGCEACEDAACGLKSALIREFNALGIADMEPIRELYALRGATVNAEYALPGGQKVRVWDDDRVYLGNRERKKGTDRYYGLTGDERFLLVCECEFDGSDAEIVVFKRRRSAD